MNKLLAGAVVLSAAIANAAAAADTQAVTLKVDGAV